MGWFVKTWLEPEAKPLNVLDVGSCEVAGGSYRRFFPEPDYHYTGLDMAPGPNVDIIPRLPYHWPELATESFDVVISGQAFEHMEFFWLAALEMSRALKPLGLLCIVAPRGFQRHRYPVDCYRFDADGMTALARWCNLEILHVSTDMAPPEAGSGWHIEGCEDSLLVARKPAVWPGPVRAEEYRFVEPPEDGPRGNFAPAPGPAPEAPPPSPEPDAPDPAQAVLQAMAAELEDLRARVELYESSNSWRLTRPLRKLGKIIRAAFRPRF